MRSDITTLKQLSCILLVLACGLIPCRARLGETRDQCIARYGQPTSSKLEPDVSGIGEGSATFYKGDFSIYITFYKGVAAVEMFKKSDGSQFVDKEIMTLLAADAAGEQWNADGTPDPDMRFVRDDGTRAMFRTVEERLTIVSAEYGKAAMSKHDADMKGF